MELFLKTLRERRRISNFQKFYKFILDFEKKLKNLNEGLSLNYLNKLLKEENFKELLIIQKLLYKFYSKNGSKFLKVYKIPKLKICEFFEDLLEKSFVETENLKKELQILVKFKKDDSQLQRIKNMFFLLVDHYPNVMLGEIKYLKDICSVYINLIKMTLYRNPEKIMNSGEILLNSIETDYVSEIVKSLRVFVENYNKDKKFDYLKLSKIIYEIDAKIKLFLPRIET